MDISFEMSEERELAEREGQDPVISEKEKRYLEKAARGAKRNGYFITGLSIFFMAVGVVLILMFSGTDDLLELISIVGVNVSALIMFLVALKYLWPKRVRLDIEGIAVPPSKRMSRAIIKYRWIEQVLMNDRMDCDAYAIVLFTDDEREKYAYYILQRGLDDPADFVVKLREKGIYVRILNPSCLRQKYMDIYWMSKLTKGRKVIYR